MNSKAPRCLYCGGEKIVAHWDSKDELGQQWRSARCGECGTQSLVPPPTAEQLARAYDDSYYGSGETKFSPMVERIRSLTAGGRARSLAKKVPAGGTVLDVGCGDGRFLRQIGTCGSFKLFGLEPPGIAAERAARVPGLTLHTGDLQSAKYPAASFDLITLIHVFEHLPAPKETLEELSRILKPGGWLLLAFPNVTSWQARVFRGKWFHLDPPRHLSLVPAATVARTLSDFGFRQTEASHLCLEQNVYGWTQSFLNAVSADRNILYEVLKRNRTYRQRFRSFHITIHAAVTALSLILALVLELMAAACRRGATVDLLFRKER